MYQLEEFSKNSGEKQHCITGRWLLEELVYEFLDSLKPNEFASLKEQALSQMTDEELKQFLLQILR